jgi:hypothetical protein
MSTTSAPASSWRVDNSLRPLRGNLSPLRLEKSRPSTVQYYSTGARSLISWRCIPVLGSHLRTQDLRNFCHSESRQVENRSRSSRLKTRVRQNYFPGSWPPRVLQHRHASVTSLDSSLEMHPKLVTSWNTRGRIHKGTMSRILK